MSPEASAISAAWNRLGGDAAPTADTDVPTIELDVPTGYGNARLALGPNRETRLLLPVSETERLRPLPKTSSLELTISILSFRGASRRYLDLSCTAAELDGVFGQLVEVILQRIAEGANCLQACISTVEDFKSLLEARAQVRVTHEEILGLVGELLYLRRLTTYDPRAVALWRGPYGDQHDFRGGTLSVEIKTASRQTADIRISSIDQLNPPSGGILFLARFVLAAAEGGKLSVNDLCTEICNLGAGKEQLLLAIARIGCPAFDDPAWNAVRFNMETLQIFRVAEDFPCIVPKRFLAGQPDAGVREISYAIDISTVRQFLVSEADAKSIEEQVCRYL